MMIKNAIRFLRQNDILWNENVAKSINLLDSNLKVDSIVDAINCYNSYLYINTGVVGKEWNDQDLAGYRKKSKTAKLLAVGFVKSHFNQILNEFDDYSFSLLSDLFHLISEQQLFFSIDKDDFERIITDKTIRAILSNKKLALYYDDAVTAYLDNNKRIANQLLMEDKALGLTGEKLYFPEEYDAQKRIECYRWIIYDDNSSIGEIESILKTKNHGLSPSEIASAKKRLKVLRAELEQNPNISWMTREYHIQIVDKENKPVDYSFDEKRVLISYGGAYLLKHIKSGRPFLSMISPFSFMDTKARILFAKRNKKVSLTEDMLPKHKDCYNLDSIQNSLLPLITSSFFVYDSFLHRNNLSIEYCVEVLFNEFVEKTYGINDYKVKLPSSGSSFFDKCCAMGPSIENLLRLHKCLADQGKIDTDYLESDRVIDIGVLQSMVPDKYCYLSESYDKYLTLLETQTLLCSNQAVFYRDDRKVTNNYEMFSKFKCARTDFESFELPSISYLLNENCIQEKDGYLTLTKKATLLKELWDYDYISTYHYGDMDYLAEMVENGCLKTASTLFAKPEIDIIDFFLKERFPDGFNLRNNYDHGKWCIKADEEYKRDYYLFVYLMSCIEVKIIDDYDCAKAMRIVMSSINNGQA